MTDQAPNPSEVVEAFLDAFAAMDFDTALAHLADDVEYTNIPLMTVRGHAGVREVHDGKITVWRDYFDLLTAAKINEVGAA